jgi:AcrR family transcriptional regulator
MSREYKKRKRAESEAQTKLRITEAAVDLHGSVGPAKTTISAIADRAGVQRATVYRHFPDEESLFAACSSHWSAANPPPSLESWGRIPDPDARLRTGLAELYAWYDGTEYMLEKTTRDVALVPAMRSAMEGFGGWFGSALETLDRGRPERGARRARARGAIGHALDFDTWRSLVRRQGLDPADAVRLMTAMVDGC